MTTFRERVEGLFGRIAFGTMVLAWVGYFAYERMHDAHWIAIEQAADVEAAADRERIRAEITDLRVYFADQLGHHRGEHGTAHCP